MRTAVMLAFEGGLGVLALVLGAILDTAPLATLRLNASALVSGTLATLPMFALFGALWWSRAGFLEGIRARVIQAVTELFAGASVGEIALVSAAAGFGEETLFRGLVQGGLEPAVGPWAALVVASAAFGLVHPVTRAYVALAAALGLYLGGLWMVTHNLLAPITAHAVYDFVALTAILRPARPPRRLTSRSQ